MINGTYYEPGASISRTTRKPARSAAGKRGKANPKNSRKRAAQPVAVKPAQAGPDTQLGLIADHSLALRTQEAPIDLPIGELKTTSTALAAFMRDAGTVPLLTVEEEVELAARIKQGDQEARDRMIRANLRLVVKIARDYEHLGLPLLDLISEGCIGLMKAVDRFDPAKGGKLSTYGSWWIKQQIRRALANQGRTIRLPVHVEAKIYRLGRAEVKLRDVLGREATDEELADEMGVNARRIRRLRNSSVRPASLDAPVGEDGDASLSELIGDASSADPSQVFELKADRTLVMKLLKHLTRREMEILNCRFGLDGREEQTLEELGEKFGLTRERIRQLQNEAFKKLRSLMESNRRLPEAA